MAGVEVELGVGERGGEGEMIRSDRADSPSLRRIAEETRKSPPLLSPCARLSQWALN